MLSKTDHSFVAGAHQGHDVESPRHASPAAPRASAVAPRTGQRAGRQKPRSRDPQRRGAVLAKPWFIWAVGCLVGVVGFLAVLWFSEPTPPTPPGAAVLAKMTVSDAATLMTAVQSAGLRGSPDIRGAIEKIKRQDDGRVLIKGWVVDVAARYSPVTIMAFADGKHVLTMPTGGARHDLGHALGLSDAVPTDPSFQSIVPCEHGRKLIVIAVAADNTYSQFGSLVCP